MRSILEKALVHLLNEENEQAETLFHKFMVQKARQIHESLRQGDDEVLESFDDINTDEMFEAGDLEGLEDGSDEFAAGDDAAAVPGDEIAADDAVSAETDDAAADLGADLGADVATDDADLGADLGADIGAEGDEMAELTAKIDELTALFKAAIEGGDTDETAAAPEADAFGGETSTDADEDTFGGEVDADAGSDVEDADGIEDDMQDEVKESAEDDADDCEKDEEEDFDDISESVVSELEKVLVSMTDAKEVGAGKSFTNNTKSPALQGKPNPMTDGKPVGTKGGEHKGFERETAPSVADMKKRKNTKSKSSDGQSSVSKEGDKAALINKTPGAEAQTRSPLAKR